MPRGTSFGDYDSNSGGNYGGSGWSGGADYSSSNYNCSDVASSNCNNVAPQTTPATVIWDGDTYDFSGGMSAQIDWSKYDSSGGISDSACRGASSGMMAGLAAGAVWGGVSGAVSGGVSGAVGGAVSEVWNNHISK